MALDRRRFITWSAAGAFALAFRPEGASAADAAELSPWIRIAPDGKVTLYTTASEMGQGAKTGQAQILADELDVAWDQVLVEQVPDVAPFNTGFGDGAGGSSSIRAHWSQLRKAAATARAQLTTAAAKRWGCAESECEAALGAVTRKGAAARLTYAELASEAATCAAPADPPLKPPAARRYIGKPLSTLENVSKTRGEATFGIDVRLPGMLRASVRQSPAYGGKLVSVDEAPALAIEGVRKVVKLDAAGRDRAGYLERLQGRAGAGAAVDNARDAVPLGRYRSPPAGGPGRA